MSGPAERSGVGLGSFAFGGGARAGLRSLALAAHSGTSWTPDDRADQEVAAAESHLAEARAWIAQNVGEERRVSTFAKYEADYLAVLRKYLHSRSGLVSAMIAGPSNFPVRRMEKRGNVVHKRMGELVEWPAKARARILRAEHELTKPDDPSEELRAEIAAMTERLDAMKAINKIVRKKATTDEKVAAIVATVGFSEATARKCLEPDVCGGIGLQSYQLTSLRGKIERLEARLRAIDSAKTCEATEGDGWRVEEDIRDQRLRVHFDSRPGPEMVAKLKASGFKWSPRSGAWQRQLTENARRSLQRLALPTPAQTTPAEPSDTGRASE